MSHVMLDACVRTPSRNAYQTNNANEQPLWWRTALQASGTPPLARRRRVAFWPCGSLGVPSALKDPQAVSRGLPTWGSPSQPPTSSPAPAARQPPAPAPGPSAAPRSGGRRGPQQWLPAEPAGRPAPAALRRQGLRRSRPGAAARRAAWSCRQQGGGGAGAQRSAARRCRGFAGGA
jgi:hypothetical protein